MIEILKFTNFPIANPYKNYFGSFTTQLLLIAWYISIVFLPSACLAATLKLCLFFSDIYKSNKLVESFEEILANIFLPLFEATKDPKSHPELHMFLQHVSNYSNR